MRRKWFPILSLLLFPACRDFPCGVHEDLQPLLDRARARYPSLIRVEPIPCEPFAIQLLLRTAEVDTAKIAAVQRELFDATRGNGWRTVIVYDLHGNYLFNRFYTGSISLEGEAGL